MENIINSEANDINSNVNNPLTNYYYNQYSNDYIIPHLAYKDVNEQYSIPNDINNMKLDNTMTRIKVDNNIDYSNYVNMDFYNTNNDLIKGTSTSENSEPSPNTFNSSTFQTNDNTTNNTLPNNSINNILNTSNAIPFNMSLPLDIQNIPYSNSTNNTNNNLLNLNLLSLPANNNFISDNTNKLIPNNTTMATNMSLLNNNNSRINYNMNYNAPNYYNGVMLQSWQDMMKGYNNSYYNMGLNNRKTYSFVTMSTTKTKKRHRRKFDEIERHYKCNHPTCDKSYGTLNNLNAHIIMQRHGPKRSAFEFKNIGRKPSKR